jgi:hypothetical protein
MMLLCCERSNSRSVKKLAGVFLDEVVESAYSMCVCVFIKISLVDASKRANSAVVLLAV